VNITMNEKPADVAAGLTLAEIAELLKPGADVLILNGFPAAPATSEAKPGSGLMAPRVGIAASHLANQVVRLILGRRTD
jgi:hypothetical protein